MIKNVKELLEAGVLEKYAMGTCDEETRKLVEHYIETEPEVRQEYEALQENIERAAEKLAIDAPAGLKDAIVSCLEAEDEYKIKSKLTKQRTKRMRIQFIPWAAAIIGLISSVSFYQHNKNLKSHNIALHSDNNKLEQKFREQGAELALLEEKLFISGHNKTARVMLAGNTLSPDFRTTAFWNNVAKKVVLYINDLGPLDAKHCYQVWGDVDGKMINLGMLPHKPGPIELNYLEDVESINITMEPKGGSEHPTISNLISSAELSEF